MFVVVKPSMSWWRRQRAAGPAAGWCGEYRWEAYLARGPVSYGLHPGTLYKGAGRIVRLTLYAPIPGTRLWQRVAAYNRGWVCGRRAHLGAIRQIVAELEPPAARGGPQRPPRGGAAAAWRPANGQ